MNLPSAERWAPLVFVLLWSTGFIGAKLGMPHAEPMTFLSLRFLLVIALLAPFAWFGKARWPGRLQDWGHAAVVGLLVHAGYLGGVFSAIKQGMPAAMAALIVGLQPLLTALLAGPLFGEVLTRRRWGGLLLGFFGVALVVSEKLPEDTGVSGSSLLLTGLSLISITGGTLYQKRFATGLDLRSGAVIQYIGALFACGMLALALESRAVTWNAESIFALGWLVVVLSIGAIFLLMQLIRMGEAANVASLFYLVPPATAVEAWLLFDEQLGLLALVGLLVTAVGVSLVVKKPKE